MRIASRALIGALCAALFTAAPTAAQVVRAFTARTNLSMNGDITLIGNTLMSCTGNGACANGRNGTGGSINDNDFNMAYVDVDGDASTFSSSSATLTLPATGTVVWAALYWSGDSNNGARNTVKFSTPAAGYVTLTASQLDASGTVYQGLIDVTSRVQTGGNGSYTVANVQSTTGANHFAGWSLVAVYRDNTLPARNLVVFDGYAQVAPGATVTLPVSGFVTPPAGAVNTRLGVVAGEGDLGYTGDSFLLNGTALADAQNPSDNFFNSSISLLGTTFTNKTPNYKNQLGWDVDLVSANGILPNNAVSAVITLNSTNDRYYPGVVTFATDLYQPILDGNSFTKTVADLNGGNVQPGDVLEYTVAMTNTGQDNAINIVMLDTLATSVTYVTGSLSVASGANAGAKTDAAADDQMEYDAANRRVIARLGTGANAASGGSLAPGISTSAIFRVRVNAPAPTGTVISNQAALNFNGQQLGTPFSTRSDGNTNVAGSQPTTVSVTSATLSGTVFEDVNYGGGAGRTLAASSGAGRPAVRAELYDSTGAYLSNVTASAAGVYLFDGWAAGRYTVRIVHSTVTSSRPGAVPTLVPVQTFRTDASSGTAVADPNRVGGEIPMRADAAANTTGQTLAALTSASATAQSVSPVTLGSANVTGVDFGFNFDTIVNANDSGAGSLRQFVINSDALSNAGLSQVSQSAGVECSIFMVSDGALHPGLRAGLANALTGGVVAIALQSALPAITDAATRIDGSTQTSNVGDTNPGTLGTGGTVGVDALALGTVARPEVELRDGAGLAIGLDLQAANETVRSIAIYGFGNATGSNSDADLRVGAAASGALIERAIIGTSATSFADSGAAARSGGDHVHSLGGANGIVRDNLIAYGAGHGIALTAGSNGWQITDNEIRSNSIGSGVRSGISIESSGSETLTGNLVTSHESAGVDARTSTGSNPFTNNTITRSGLGTAVSSATPGVRLGGSANQLMRNLLFDNVGAGVMVASGSSGNVISRNSIWGNGVILNNGGGGPTGQIGIDLQAAGDDITRGSGPFVTLNDNGDGDAGGDGLLNFPVLESAVLANGNFTIAGWARPGSTIELFIADPDPSGFGEGRTYATTMVEGSAADLDLSASAYSGAINGVNQGTDNTNRFRFTIAAPSGVTAGVQLTATATLAEGTSEFSGLVSVTTGVSVSGFAYADLNHSLARDAGEAGTGASLWAKLVLQSAPSSARQVAVVDPATGAYAFTFVNAGTYNVLVDDNASAADVTPTMPAGWVGTETASGTWVGAAVAGADLANLNFGFFHGSRVDGSVFRDDGAGLGVANDGAPQAGESGIAGVRVALLSSACAGGECDSTLTAGSGTFTLWMPFTAAGAASVIERNPTGFLSTGGGAGSTGGSYSRASDQMSFTAVPGVTWTGLAFGDVPMNTLAPNGAQTVASGAVAFYSHRFIAGSQGSVTFAAAQIPSPALPGWSTALYLDNNCNGAVDAGEPLASGALGVAAGQTVCLVLKQDSPAGAPPGALSQATLSASFSYINSVPALASQSSANDVTTVLGGGSGLVIAKSVNLSTAKPGDVLTYTITYTNNGPSALSSIVIRDATPAFTVFQSAACGALGSGLSGCGLTSQPAAGATGPVIWTLSGTLSPGASGSVTYRVKVP
ncbi:MAG: DUF11 domain-containing protein [Candidatus Eisenbacteria bacterium]|nr:DUF11 domain-containing protein [Candidatus Eisenbacteria bacterium]